MNKSTIIIDFSPRNAGNCSKIGEFIKDFHKRTNVRSYKITAENYLPCHGCDYECLRQGQSCPAVTDYQTDVMDAICSADTVYMIVPNFCGYPNGNFFAFNERSVGYFGGDRSKLDQYMSVPKKFIIVSNTESEQFRNAMKQQTSAEPEILYLKSGKYQKRSIAGDILESAEARADLEAFLASETHA